jgi:hypothetical protein
MTAAKKAAGNGVVDHTKWTLAQFGEAADAVIAEAVTRRERETREATVAAMVVGNRAGALGICVGGFTDAAAFDDGQLREHRAVLAAATAKTVEMGGGGL